MCEKWNASNAGENQCGSFKEQENKASGRRQTRQGDQTRPDVPEGTVADFLHDRPGANPRKELYPHNWPGANANKNKTCINRLGASSKKNITCIIGLAPIPKQNMTCIIGQGPVPKNNIACISGRVPALKKKITHIIGRVPVPAYTARCRSQRIIQSA